MEKSLLSNYQGYLNTILSGIEFVPDEDGNYDLRTVTRIAKVAYTTVRRCNTFIKSKEVNESEREYWECLKLTAIALLSDLSDIIAKIFGEAKTQGTTWQFLYLFEVCTEITTVLKNEQILTEGGEEVSVGTLTEEELKRITASVI